MLSPFYKISLACAVMLLASHAVLQAQEKLPYDAASGRIVYKFSVDADKSVKKKALYNLLQDWFYQNTELFSRSNTTDTLKTADKKKNENKEAVLREFANLTPLQHTDPESDRLSGKVIMKYTGSSNGCIRMFYVQYALVIIVEDNKLTGEVCNIRYNHFNPNTYQTQPVFNWSGQMPCDEVNTLEYLKDCEVCHDEFAKFSSFLNKDVEELLNSLRSFVKANRAVSLNVN
jgi:hypothetical protein